MRWIILAFALLFSTAASAQCNGSFPVNYACGTVGGGPPGPIPFLSIIAPFAPSSPQIHQGGGGTSFGASLVWANQNFNLTADNFSIATQDQSLLYTITIGGSPAAGNTVTLTATISTVAYPITYTVQSGDTTSTTAAALAACLNGGTTNCTGSTAFTAAMLAFHGPDGFGYRAGAGATAAAIAMDFPWAASGNSLTSSASGGGATIVVTGTNSTANLDNSPVIGTGRNVTGRTPLSGDQPANIQYGCQSGPNTSIDTLCAEEPIIYLGGGVKTAYATHAFGGVAGSTQGPIAWYVGPMGVYTADVAGDGNGCGGFAVDTFSTSDPGYGNISACGAVYVGAGLGILTYNAADGAVLQGTGTNDVTFKNRSGVGVCNIAGAGTALQCTSLGLATPLAPNSGGTGLNAATAVAHSLIQSEGASAFNLITAVTGGNIPIDQGAGSDWLSKTVSGDGSLATSGALTITKTNGTAFGNLATANAGTGLTKSGSTLNSNAELIDTFAPGLVTAVVNTKAGFTKWVTTSTVDNLVASATSFTCTGNPIITYYECGTDATCASPTSIAAVAVSAGGQAFPASTISAQTISAAHYTAWAISSGTCASLDIFGKVQAHAN